MKASRSTKGPRKQWFPTCRILRALSRRPRLTLRLIDEGILRRVIAFVRCGAHRLAADAAHTIPHVCDEHSFCPQEIFRTMHESPVLHSNRAVCRCQPDGPRDRHTCPQHFGSRSRPAGRFRADPPTARVWRRAWLPPEARGSRPAAFWLKAGVPVSIRGFFRDRRPDRTRKRVGPDSFCQKAKLVGAVQATFCTHL